VRALFDYIDPILGDDLTNSEDIFIGFSMLNEGYRNIQLVDVHAHTVEPEIHRLPRQIYLWSSSFLQSCYYFDPLVRSPFKMVKRWLAQRRASWAPRRVESVPSQAPARTFSTAVPAAAVAGLGVGTSFPLTRGSISDAPAQRRETGTGSGTSPRDRRERRVVREPYRQGFGRARTASHGRPAGWILAMSAAEKVFFPTALLIMLLLRHWEALAVTVAAETAICVASLMFVMKGRRMEMLLKGIAVTPVRYALLGSELITIGRFASDLWITKNRKWRK
jgi:hypothetical protein